MKWTQRERTVVSVAGRTLCDHVRERPGVVVADYWTECRLKTPTKRWRGRADAVIAARMQDGSVYTICVEAKSLRTFDALRGDDGMGTHLGLAGAVSLIVAGAAWWKVGGLLGAAAALIALLTSTLFIIWLLDKARLFASRAAVLDQAARYPGNERWIAVAQDALRKSDEAFGNLLGDCRKAGFGVLGVPRRGDAIIHLQAIRNHERGDHLPLYARADQILEHLGAETREKSHTRTTTTSEATA